MAPARSRRDSQVRGGKGIERARSCLDGLRCPLAGGQGAFDVPGVLGRRLGRRPVQPPTEKWLPVEGGPRSE